MHVDNAIRSRKSVRRFLPLGISKPVIEHILQVASRAPSGNNLQPWHVHVLTGDAKQALCTDILESAALEAEAHDPEYQYYPNSWFEPIRAVAAPPVLVCMKRSASTATTGRHASARTCETFTSSTRRSAC